MDRPDDSPTRSIREARRSSIPMTIESQNHLHQQQQQQPQPQLQLQPQSQSQPQPPTTSSASLPPFPRRRSSPLSSTASVQQQHVSISSSISQPIPTAHPLLMDDHQDSATNVNQPLQQQQQLRSIQRIPPPPLTSIIDPDHDNRYNALRDEWSLTDQYLDIDHHHNHNHIHDAALAGNPPPPGQVNAVNTATIAVVPSSAMPKGPIIERERRDQQPKDSLRDVDMALAAANNGAVSAHGPTTASGRNDSLRRATRPPLPQPPQTKPNESPPLSSNLTQSQHPPQRPSLYSDRSSSQTVTLSRGSPTYVATGGEFQHQQQRQQQQPSPTHKRDNSPPFRYDERERERERERDRDRERFQPTTKARTPDRSLPVQEENEVEEDVTIKPSPPLAHSHPHSHSHSHPHPVPDRVREREMEVLRERDRQRERERDRDRELDSETIKPRQLGHRLPTPQFPSSPMIPGGEGGNEAIASTVGAEDLAIAAVAHNEDEYDDERDGRSSRAGHRYEEEEEEEIDPEGPRATKGHERVENNNGNLVQQHELEEQEDTETYTPRSPPAILPPHLANANTNHTKNSNSNNNENNNNVDVNLHNHDQNHTMSNNNNHAERIMYQHHANPSLSHLHFRPRTASSDAGGMPNLDAAVLQHPFAADYNHSRGAANRASLDASASFAQSYPFGAHTSPPQRVPTIDEIRAIADGALYRQQQTTTTRPGAPIPPTPPNNGAGGMLYPPFAAAYPYLQPTLSPPPPRATPYPFSYPSYQYMMQQGQGQGQGLQGQSPAPDPHQMLQHLLGMQTDSTFSPSSTPYPTYDYSPFLPEHFRRRNNNDPTLSMRSSPSHMPVHLPFFPINTARIRAKLNQKRQRRKTTTTTSAAAAAATTATTRTLRRTQSQRELARGLVPRGESTEPRETTPEPLDDDDDDDIQQEEEEEEEDEEDDLEEQYHDIMDHSPRGGTSSSTERGKGFLSGGAGGGGNAVVVVKEDNGNAVPVHNEDDDEEEVNWIDEDDDEDDETVTGLGVVPQYYHYESLPVYHPNPEKRRRRWEARWNELVKAFQNFDRETNSSMILMAAPAQPSHVIANNASTHTHTSPTLYSIRSRSLRRTSLQTQSKQFAMRKLRTVFQNLATSKSPQLPSSVSSPSSPYHSHDHQNHHDNHDPHPTSHMSLVERFEHYSSSSDTVDSETREEELRNTLGAALSTINALTNIYEGRDQRWISEMGMRRDERERVDILLRQAFGFGLGGS